MSRLWRLFHDQADLRPGLAIDLESNEAHHASRVLRLRAGEAVTVFDGRGGEWHAVVQVCEPGRARLELGEAVTASVETSLALTLVQGMCRPEAMDWVVQKATEVGVRELLVLPTEARGATPDVNPRRFARWQRVAMEACKQCGRNRLPQLRMLDKDPPEPPEPPAGLGLLLDTRAEAPPLGRWLQGQPVGQVTLLVGPEGGFSPERCEAWIEQGWRPASLGPRVLRTETAGVIAAALVLHRWGDLGS